MLHAIPIHSRIRELLPTPRRDRAGADGPRRPVAFVTPDCSAACGRAGFTLVEIMVVVIVLAILAATVIPQFASTAHDAKVSAAMSSIRTYKNALERFFVHMDRYPTTAEGLSALVSPPPQGASNWKGPYIEEIVPDPWGNPFVYVSPGQHGSGKYDLWSRGADGADGGEGKNADVTSWRQ